jgi:hypothetical protein
LPGSGLVAADARIERAKQANEKDGQFKGFGTALQQEILPFHARDGRFGNTQQRRKRSGH